jgi:hypothetical protein
MFKYILAGLGALVASVLIVCLFAFPIDQPIVPEIPGGVYSDYPVNMEMKLDDNSGFSVVQKVTFDQKTSEYVYYIRIEYLSDENESIFFRWTVLDILEGSEQEPYMMELVPGDIKEFTYKSTSPPRFHSGIFTTMYKLEGNKWAFDEHEDPVMGPIPSE